MLLSFWTEILEDRKEDRLRLVDEEKRGTFEFELLDYWIKFCDIEMGN